ncbi:MAG: M43 family zinc metalloprotease [Saprospiraceae bacterium]
MILRIAIFIFFAMPATFSFSQKTWCHAFNALKTKEDSAKYNLFLEKVRDQQLHPIFHSRSEIWYQVVVHIVVRESSTFISNTQIIQQIDVLNEDFAGKGENIANLENEFTSLIADTGIRFCLAKTDPDGKPTDGITYKFTDKHDIALQTGVGGRSVIHFDLLGGKTGWDPARYINIWVGEYGSYLGSAYFPGMAPYPEEIGVVIDPRSFGSLGDAAEHTFYDRGHTLTHEMGHFFGLKHIWGDDEHNCNDSDEVDDTPNQDGPYFDCPDGIQMSCGVSNMYQNFMDLTDDRCLAAFTSGQSDRMHASINAFYPNLAASPCHEEIVPFQKWYDELIWAFDRNSSLYVIYHPEGFSGALKIEVYSNDGRLMIKDTWDDSQTYLLDLNSFAHGIYFVRISNGTDDSVRKVVTY